MNSRTTNQFWECYRLLPKHVKLQAREAYRIFELNNSHPGLHFKKVILNPPTYSVRVGIGYRALGVVDNDTIIWFWIGTHAEYDQILG
jgi:hypothetical protein